MDVAVLAQELGIAAPAPLILHALTRNASPKSLPFKITLSPEQRIGKCMCGWLCITDDIDAAYDLHLHPIPNLEVAE